MSSNFNSSARFSAYWAYTEGSFYNVCGTQGASFLRRLRVALGLPASGPWDDSVQAQLIAQVNSLLPESAAWSNVLTELQSDAANRTVGVMSTRMAVWQTYYRPSGRRFDGIQFGDSTVFPYWGITPPDDRAYNGGQLLCYDPSLDPDFAVIQSGDLARATANSATGVRLEPGRAAPQSGVDVVSGGPETVSALTAVAISVLIVGAAALVFGRKQA